MWVKVKQRNHYLDAESLAYLAVKVVSSGRGFVMEGKLAMFTGSGGGWLVGGLLIGRDFEILIKALKGYKQMDTCFAQNTGLIAFFGVLATLVSPFLTLWLQKIYTEKRVKKLNIFKTLMATRADVISIKHVEALNMIDIEFYKKKNIEHAWNIYRNHLNSSMCDFLLASSILQKETIGTLSSTYNGIYIRYENQLYYVNKKNNEYRTINDLSAKKLEALDEKIKVNNFSKDKVRTLTVTELESIRLITNHIHIPNEEDNTYWVNKSRDCLAELLFSMSKFFRYKLTKDILRNGAYLPGVHFRKPYQEESIRTLLIKELNRETAIKIETSSPNNTNQSHQ